MACGNQGCVLLLHCLQLATTNAVWLLGRLQQR
jgi:hypothetical protein